MRKLHEVDQPIFVAEVYILHGDSVLLFKRSETKKKFPGWWSIPGGHIDEHEDPLTAAIREVEEETGIQISPADIALKVVAIHHHVDLQEMYIVYSFVAKLTQLPAQLTKNEEGEPHWIKKSEAYNLENIFPPVKYYFRHVLEEKTGVLYNRSTWENRQLKEVLSEVVDSNY